METESHIVWVGLLCQNWNFLKWGILYLMLGNWNFWKQQMKEENTAWKLYVLKRV